MELKAPWLKYYDGIKEKLEYPDITMSEAVFDIARKFGDNTALVYMGKKISYREFTRRILRVQSALEAEGLTAGDRIAVCLPNIPQAVYVLYAADRIGAVSSFIHPLSAVGEFIKYIEELDAKFVVALDSMEGTFAEVFSQTGQRKLILTGPADELNFYSRGLYNLSRKNKKRDDSHSVTDAVCWLEMMRKKQCKCSACAEKTPEDTAVVLFSGGTTGEPKGVMLSGLGLNAMAWQTVEMSHCDVAGKSMLAAMPMFHGFGLGVCVHTVLIHGAACILVPRFTVKEYAKLIKKYRPNFIAGVPTLFEALTREPCMDKVDLSCLLGVFSGGDSLPIQLKKKFDGFLKEHKAKVKIREGYGATECVTASCLTPYNTEREGSIGIPFPDTYYKICKVGTTEEVPYNTEGEICIHGPAIMKGYLNSPQDTAKVLRQHSDGYMWLHTGDLGVMDEDGFVYFRQRLKRIIVTSGYNVYPSAIEEVLNAHPKVKSSCVIGVKDPYRMQRVKAYIVPKENTSADDNLKEEILAFCRHNVARYSVPSEIEFRKLLPMTKVGKVAYKQLEAEADSPQV